MSGLCGHLFEFGEQIVSRIRNLLRKLGYLLTLFLPWILRRAFLNALFGFKIDPTARIGLSWFIPNHLEMGPRSSIGHFNVCKGLDLVVIGPDASIGRLNWITGFPSDDRTHFTQDVNRRPELILEEHSAVTNRHILDCTNLIHVGAFSTVAGFRSQFLTHSIDLGNCRQGSKPITIGAYCFVGTGVIILGGSVLPNKCVLGAGSVLQKNYDSESTLYAGAPAKPIKEIDTRKGYFVREKGFVV